MCLESQIWTLLYGGLFLLLETLNTPGFCHCAYYCYSLFISFIGLCLILYYFVFWSGLRICNILMRIWIPLFTFMPIWIRLFTLLGIPIRIRILLLLVIKTICNHWSTDLHGSMSLNALHCEQPRPSMSIALFWASEAPEFCWSGSAKPGSDEFRSTVDWAPYWISALLCKYYMVQFEFWLLYFRRAKERHFKRFFFLGFARGVAEYSGSGRRPEPEEAAGRGSGEVHTHLRQNTLKQSW